MSVLSGQRLCQPPVHGPKDRQTPPDARAQHRAYVLEHVVDDGLTIDQAAHILRTCRPGRSPGCSSVTATVRRPSPMAPGARPPANRLDPDRRAQLVKLATTTYAGVNHSHLAELLAEREGIVVAERTLRRIPAEAGLRPVRRRRPPKHRSRRDRMPRVGLLLKGRRQPPRLARGPGPSSPSSGGSTTRRARSPARRSESRRTPLATLRCSPRRPTTGVSRAPSTPTATGSSCATRTARRPASAGSVPAARRPRVGSSASGARVWIGSSVSSGWAGATTLEEANAVLAQYLPRHNERFAVPAVDPRAGLAVVAPTAPVQTPSLLPLSRRVANDATISWPGGPLKLPRRPNGRSWAGRTVTLHERLDGSLWVEHEGTCSSVRPAPPNAGQLLARDLMDAVGSRSAGRGGGPPVEGEDHSGVAPR